MFLNPPSYHLYGLWVEGLDEDPPARGHALHQLVERGALDLLPLQVGHAVQEVEHHAALLQLLAEQVVQLCHRGIWTGGVRGQRAQQVRWRWMGPRAELSPRRVKRDEDPEEEQIFQ